MSKGRKTGDWVAVAKGRANKVRDLRIGSGLAASPRLTDTGSAAYRRLQEKQTRKGGK